VPFVAGVNRSGWKKPRTRRIDAEERDRLHAAIREASEDLEAIAQRFELGMSTVRKHAGLVGIKSGRQR
jgi:hypothetical protein